MGNGPFVTCCLNQQKCQLNWGKSQQYYYLQNWTNSLIIQLARDYYPSDVILQIYLVIIELNIVSVPQCCDKSCGTEIAKSDIVSMPIFLSRVIKADVILDLSQ